MKILTDIFRGFGMIFRDIHNWLYARLGARVWVGYIVALFIFWLWATGQLVRVVTTLLLIAVLVFAAWLILRELFRIKKKK